MKIIIEQVIKNYDEGGTFVKGMERKTIKVEGKEFTYIKSGLCRNVFISPCGEWVAKVPIVDKSLSIYFSERLQITRLPFHFTHNELEYQAYIECPEIFLPHLAETKILEDGTIIQKFVDVFQVAFGNSLGRCKTTGAIQVFDFDIFFAPMSFERPKDGFRYYNAVIKNDGFPENVKKWAYDCYMQASVRKNQFV